VITERRARSDRILTAQSDEIDHVVWTTSGEGLAVNPEKQSRDTVSVTPHAVLSRRGFLGAAATAGSAATVIAILGTSPAGAAVNAGPSLSAERAMILQVARVGSVFPIKLPAPVLLNRLGLTLSEYQPPTMARLRSAEGRLSTGRLAAARTGADGLIAAGLLHTDQVGLLAGIGREMTAGSQSVRDGLLAAVTLAIATVLPSVYTASDKAARTWTGIVASNYQHGALRPGARRKWFR
jgi:hypothetical protein